MHSFVLWAAETTYNTPVAVTTHLSGAFQNFKGTINNNVVDNYAFSGSAEADGRKIYNYTPGLLEIGGSAEFKVTNFRWFKQVLGTETGAVSPWTYTPSAIPGSITLASDIDNPGSAATDQEANYSGGVYETVTLKSSVGQPVMASVDFKFAKVILDTSLSSRVDLPTEGAYNFAYGSVELPGGSGLSNIIDSIELTIRNNWTMLAGHGSRLVQSAVPKGLSITAKVTLKYLDNALFTAALGATTPTATGGPTESATVILNFGNTDGDTFVATLSNVPMSDFAQSHNLQEPIGEDFSLTAKNISCVETHA